VPTDAGSPAAWRDRNGKCVCWNWERFANGARLRAAEAAGFELFEGDILAASIPASEARRRARYQTSVRDIAHPAESLRPAEPPPV